MNPMLIFIMVVLVLMNSIGYLGTPAAPGNGYRYGWGGLGLVILIVLLLYMFGVIHA